MQSPQTQDTSTPEEVSDVVDAIAGLHREVDTVEDFYRRGLSLVAEHLRAGLGLVRIELAGGHFEGAHAPASEHAEAWKPIVQAALLEAQIEGRPLGRVVQAGASQQAVSILAVPIHPPGGTAHGALALALAAGGRELVEANLSELRALTGVLDLSCPRASEAREQRMDSGADSLCGANAAVDGALKAAQFKNAREFAFALTNGLRAKLDCEQISMGAVRGKRVRVLSISGLDEPKLKSVGTLELEQAMEECFDAGAPIVSQELSAWGEDGAEDGHLLHRQWRAKTGRSCVASIPLRVDAECVGVLSLRRPQRQPFSEEEIAAVQELMQPMGPALQLLQRAERGLFRHGRDVVLEGVRGALSPERYGLKALVAAGLAFAAWFGFGTMRFETVVPCVLQPQQTLQVSAPFQERLVESTIRQGDVVRKGDLLARLATDSLDLEKQQLAAEIEVHQVEIDQAVASGDWVAASLSQARKSLLETRLASVERRVVDSSVRASVDGVVLRGDLTHQIGQVLPQGEPLFDIAPSLNLRLELEIPERSIFEVSEGLRVRFATNARPDQPLEFQIHQVSPAAEVREANNVFLAEAGAPGGLPDWVRPGMEGVGKVHAGERRVWRIALDKVMDSFYRVWL